MDIAATVQKFATSSAYRYGDNLCFKVPMTQEHMLPGRHDPAHYCAVFPSPGRAAVICPGNGGLAAQLFLQGATEVVLIEPRGRFHAPLKAVMGLFIEINLGKQIQVFTELPTAQDHLKKIGTFDTIIWSEGADDLGDPSIVHLVTQMLKPNGSMKIEVSHGTSVHTDGKINNWRPTPECFRALVEQVAKLSPPSGGRLGTSKTYIVTEPKHTPPVVIAPVTSVSVAKEAAILAPPPAPKPEPKTEAILKPAPAPKPDSKPSEAWPRPEAPKSPLKLDAKPPIASTGSDDIMDLKRSKPTLKKP